MERDCQELLETEVDEGDDKLPALSGVARLLANATGDEYVAGLWKSTMPFDLLWRRDPSLELRWEKVRKPS